MRRPLLALAFALFGSTVACSSALPDDETEAAAVRGRAPDASYRYELEGQWTCDRTSIGLPGSTQFAGGKVSLALELDEDPLQSSKVAAVVQRRGDRPSHAETIAAGRAKVTMTRPRLTGPGEVSGSFVIASLEGRVTAGSMGQDLPHRLQYFIDGTNAAAQPVLTEGLSEGAWIAFYNLGSEGNGKSFTLAVNAHHIDESDPDETKHTRVTCTLRKTFARP